MKNKFIAISLTIIVVFVTAIYAYRRNKKYGKPTSLISSDYAKYKYPVKLGDKGKEVMQLQILINRIFSKTDIKPLDENGIFDERTKELLIRATGFESVFNEEQFARLDTLSIKNSIAETINAKE